MPQVQDLLNQVNLPRGFTPNEVMALLDVDGDGELSYDEFMLSFFRLIDNNDFQQTCLQHKHINQVRRQLQLLHQKRKGRFDAVKARLTEVERPLQRIRAGPKSEEKIEPGSSSSHEVPPLHEVQRT